TSPTLPSPKVHSALRHNNSNRGGSSREAAARAIYDSCTGGAANNGCTASLGNTFGVAEDPLAGPSDGGLEISAADASGIFSRTFGVTTGAVCSAGAAVRASAVAAAADMNLAFLRTVRSSDVLYPVKWPSTWRSCSINPRMHSI